MDPTPSDSDARKDPDLWFDDGNVQIRAENTIFRLHRSILSLRSNVFKAIFEDLPLPDRKIKVSIGKDFIRVPDGADEMRILFRGIFDSSFFESPPHHSPLHHVLAMAEMGFKYRVQNLYQRALSHLAIAFPMTLQEWDCRLDLKTFKWSNIAEKLEILATLERIPAPWLAPAVLYVCSRDSMANIVECPVWDRKKKSLSSRLKKQLLVGFVEQIAFSRRGSRIFGLYPSPGCTTTTACPAVAREWYIDFLRDVDNMPLRLLSAARWPRQIERLCQPCQVGTAQWFRRVRKQFWDVLPEIYSLPDWEALAKEKDESQADVWGTRRSLGGTEGVMDGRD